MWANSSCAHFPTARPTCASPLIRPDRRIALVCTLDRPDAKMLPLLFAAAAARELGASQVGLVAPYLAYMRQDRRFKPGEAVTSREFARLLSGAFDWLVTVDPHLHRYASLAEIYRIPTRVVHAAPLISQWIRTRIERAADHRPGQRERAMGFGGRQRCRRALRRAGEGPSRRSRRRDLHRIWATRRAARRFWSTTSSPADAP